MKRAMRFAAVAAAGILVAAACTDDDNGRPADPGTTVVQATSTASNRGAPGTAASRSDRASEITVVGKNIAFDRTELTAAAGVETTIRFDNQDSGVPHNFHIQGGSAGDFKTEIQSGPTTQTLTFTIDEPGTYTFLCDVHPTQMTGTLTIR